MKWSPHRDWLVAVVMWTLLVMSLLCVLIFAIIWFWPES